MGSRINNFPIYVVYDRSYLQKVTLDCGVGQSISGQASYMIDGDLTSYYGLSSSGGPMADVHANIIIDYGSLFFNIQLSYKVNFAEAGASIANATYTVEYSIDNITWVTLDVGNVRNSNTTLTRSETLLACRYVRFTNDQDVTSDATAVATSVYECRLMGSGF